MKLRKVLLTVTAAITVLFAGDLPAANLTGEGEWQSLRSKAVKGAWDVSLTEVDGEVKGQIALKGSNVLTGGTVQGKVDGSNIVLGVMTDGTIQATFTGVLRGNVVSGEWESDALGDNGVWQGTMR